MDERVKFVARYPDGEKMAVLCREFGIYRKTGYKIFNAASAGCARAATLTVPPHWSQVSISILNTRVRRLRPGHGGATLNGRFRFIEHSFALACRGHVVSQSAVGGEDPVEAGEIHARFRHQPGDEVQRAEWHGQMLNRAEKRFDVSQKIDRYLEPICSGFSNCL